MIFLLQRLDIYKTLLGLIKVEVAIQMPFAILVFCAFIASTRGEIDEAAIIDGASPLQVFFSIILPLLLPAIVTIIVITAVTVCNDFTLPLYFLPGSENVSVLLTLDSFMSQFASQWNMLFADVVVIIIPTLIMFMFFQKQIFSGLTAGVIKG
jgi:raffinose/stachyose/melibiose transport system permease protein